MARPPRAGRRRHSAAPAVPRLAAALVAALLAAAPRAAAGQQAPRPAAPADTAGGAAPVAFARPEEDECLGLAFGRWTPALDLAAAGHHVPNPASLAHAPNGRDWAAALESGRDTTLMLFPAWWPAGVHVQLPSGRRVVGDTVRGTAVALVADARAKNPTARVLLWLVPCGGSRDADTR